MQRIETRIGIEAAPDAVWAVLADFARYPEWNPFVRAIAGDLAVGARLTVQLELAGRAVPIRPTVLVAVPGRELTWRGSLGVGGLFDGEHRFRIEPGGPGRGVEAEQRDRSSGGSTFVHEEEFRGALVAPILGLVRARTEAGFRAMNEALKRRCEGG